jgi:predicted GNAT family N-acyltransferase
MTINIKQPETPKDFAQYYDLRWRVLRAPWQQPVGSEKDSLEDSCYHILACNTANTVIGVGRLQFNSASEAQIRYMAVDPAHHRNGVGRMLVAALEKIALENTRRHIILDAREPAVGFYEKLGYAVTEKTYLLFDSIQHFRMQKMLGL